MVCFQLTDVVVGLHYGRGFDEYGLARCAFAVYDAPNAAFQCGNNGNDKSSVAQGGHYTAFYQPFFLGTLENAVQCTADTAFGTVEFLSDARQFGTCRVLDVSVSVEYLLYLLRGAVETEHAFGKFAEVRVGGVFIVGFPMDDLEPRV